MPTPRELAKQYVDSQIGQDITPEEFYRGIIPSSGTSGGLTTRSVQTVAVDPFTGKPITSSGLSAPGTGLTQAQLQAIRDPGYNPTYETMTPSGSRSQVAAAGTPEMRLVPNAGGGVPNAAVAAINNAAPNSAVYRMWQARHGGNPYWFDARGGMDPNAGFWPGGVKPDSVLGVPGDPWAGKRRFTGPGLTGGRPTNNITVGGGSPAVREALMNRGDSFRGTATNNPYTVGQNYVGSGGYEVIAMPDGTFKRTGVSIRPPRSVSSNPPIQQARESSPANGGTTRSMESSTRWTTGY